MLDKPRDPGPDRFAGAGRPSTPGARRALRSPREALQPDAPPAPPKSRRRSRPLVATASGFLSFLGIAAVALAVGGSLGLQRVNAPGPLAIDKVVTIQPGTDISVVDQLANAGVIENRVLMTATLWLEGDRGNVKSGEYSFKQAASLREVIDLIVSGKQILHALTVPEGLTTEQVVDRLRENDVLMGDIPAVPGEGTLMPDTFKFSRGTTRDQVLRTMQTEQRRVLAEVWAHRAADNPVRSPFELVTLASIVEKETGRADERPRVAGVFVNRLARGMPLQSDPTIVYGLVGGKGTLGRGILKSELDQKTPYNTYQIVGLPPGPIANPGRAALEAVANPSRTKELYFVADGTGGHAFAETLDQHRLNVQRWRQVEKDAKDKVAPDSGPASPPPFPKANQRGDAGPDRRVYGSLNLDISGTARDAPVSVTSLPIGQTSLGPAAAFAAPARTAPAAGTATFDELDVEVAGVKSRSDPSTWDEGGSALPADPPGSPGTLQSFPVSPAQLADQRARALAYGFATQTATAPARDPGPAPAPIGKGRIIDASEGTSFDPLKDRTYDLNSPKVVPTIKALPPVQPLASVN